MEKLVLRMNNLMIEAYRAGYAQCKRDSEPEMSLTDSEAYEDSAVNIFKSYEEPALQPAKTFNGNKVKHAKVTGFKSPNHTWSDSEIDVLLNYVGFNLDEIAGLFPERTIDSIRSKFHKLGYHVVGNVVIKK